MRATRRRIVVTTVLACAVAVACPLPQRYDAYAAGSDRRPVQAPPAIYIETAVSALSTATPLPRPSTNPTDTARRQATPLPSVSIGIGRGTVVRPSTVVDPSTGAVTEVIPPGLDAATERAFRLQGQVDRAQEDALALEERVAVTNVRVLAQMDELERARLEYDRTRERFEQRLVEMYKSGFSSPIVLLLTARSLADFYTRAILLSRILADDSAIYREAEVASREAEYVSSVLDDMRAELVDMRRLYDARIETARSALAEEQALIATLSAKGRKLVAARQAATTLTRKQWRSSSIPVGTPIRFVPAILEASGRTYLVSEHQPLRYTTLGEPFSAVCSWYGDEFNGRGTASGQIFNEDDLTCASRTLPFGTRLALARGNRRIIVMVTDRGPFIAGRDLDLSKAAARALGFSGVEPVTAVFVRPANEVPRTAR